MDVQVGKTVQVSDAAVKHVAAKLRTKFNSIVIKWTADMREGSTDHSEAIAALAIAEYQEWQKAESDRSYRR